MVASKMQSHNKFSEPGPFIIHNKTIGLFCASNSFLLSIPSSPCGSEKLSKNCEKLSKGGFSSIATGDSGFTTKISTTISNGVPCYIISEGQK